MKKKKRKKILRKILLYFYVMAIFILGITFFALAIELMLKIIPRMYKLLGL